MWYLLIAVVWVLGYTNGHPLQSAERNSSRIIGGEDAPEGFAPYATALVFGEHIKLMICGGSIVTTRNVLTAAHCVYYWLGRDGELPPSFHGVIGSNKWNSGGIVIKFKDHHIHEDWDEIFIKNDIAVLDLCEDIVFNEKVAPIAISFDHVGGGEKSYVTGWGVTGPRIDEDNVINIAPIPDSLQLMFLETLSSSKCVHDMNNQDMVSAHTVNPKVEICTFHSKGHGMCNGDSGSALVLEKTGMVVGIVSWGFPCARGLPDVYVRTSAFEEFIKKHCRL